MRAPCPAHQSAEQSVSLQGTFPGGAEWDLPGCQECSWSASTGPFKTSCEPRSWLAGRAQKMVSPTLLHCWASFPLLSSCCSTAASQKSGNMEVRASHHLPGGGGGGPAPAQPCVRPPRLRQLGHARCTDLAFPAHLGQPTLLWARTLPKSEVAGVDTYMVTHNHQCGRPVPGPRMGLDVECSGESPPDCSVVQDPSRAGVALKDSSTSCLAGYLVAGVSSGKCSFGPSRQE